MIQLSTSVIEVLYSDGTRRPFDVEQLQEKLISCCISIGNRDLWIAEDIALAVEFSLKELGVGKVFTTAEVDSFVLKVLREVGFGDIADRYSENISDSLNLIPVNQENVGDAVTRYLGVSGEELQLTVNKVCNACKKIGMNEVFPSLILELAKFFHHQKFEIETETLQCTGKINKNTSSWIINTSEMYNALCDKIPPFIEQDIIKVSGVSRLFPSIKIDVYLVNLAEFYDLQKPLTELSVMPYIYELAVGIENAASLALNLFAGFQDNNSSINLPVYLKFIDTTVFANDWLASDSESSVEYIISSIYNTLKTTMILR